MHISLGLTYVLWTVSAIATFNEPTASIELARLVTSHLYPFGQLETIPQIRSLSARANCDKEEETCGEWCISADELCCKDGTICLLPEYCSDSGCMCTSEDEDGDCDDSATCRADEETCGDGCMLAGSVCCDDGTFCPADTTCPGDGECTTSSSGTKLALPAISLTLAVVFVIPF